MGLLHIPLVVEYCHRTIVHAAESEHPLTACSRPRLDTIGQTVLQLLLTALETGNHQCRLIVVASLVTERLHARHVAQRKRLEGSLNAVLHSMELAQNIASELWRQRLGIESLLAVLRALLARLNDRSTGHMPASAHWAMVAAHWGITVLSEYHLAVEGDEALSRLATVEAELHSSSVSAVLAVGYWVIILGNLMAAVSCSLARSVSHLVADLHQCLVSIESGAVFECSTSVLISTASLHEAKEERRQIEKSDDLLDFDAAKIGQIFELKK